MIPTAAKAAGSKILCPYCDFEYRPKDYSAAAIAEALKEHVAECEKHPTHQLIKALENGCELVFQIFRNIRAIHGGPSRDQAEAWLREADAALTAAAPRKARKSRKKK